MDAVQAANSGHPGTPMALAPVAYCLWQRFLRFDPADPIWLDRDRFVLSNGHASMLLYSLLHLTGVKAVNSKYEMKGEPSVTLDDIKRFRQLDSKCPGHPEYRMTSGVETTTGPLGQGVANSVGMAIASHWLAATYNRPDFQMFDFSVYCICGDGCMMEGVASEAASLAGHLKLSNLCLDLRQQPHHHRRADVLVFFGGCGHSLYRLRLECYPRRRCQRLADAGTRVQCLQEHIGSPHPDHCGQSYRLWVPQQSKIQAPHTASRWAKKKSARRSNSTAGPKMPNSWSRKACANVFRKASGNAATR